LKIQKFSLKISKVSAFSLILHQLSNPAGERRKKNDPARLLRMWSDEIWQTCPLVSGVGIRDKHSVMPVPTKIGSDWG
jgi:hypothetical protein